MTRTRIRCELCGQEISKSNYTKHIRTHQNHPETFKQSVYKVNHEGLDCQFCGKLCKSKNSLSNHERLCKFNPNRQLVRRDGFNNFGRDAWNQGLTKESDDRVAQRSITLKNRYANGELIPYNRGSKQSDEVKSKISSSMKQFLYNNPDMIPYMRNHSSKTSYPEEYFIGVFNDIPQITYHHRIGLYELDFCNVSTKRYLEIDGDQHKLDKRIIEHDIVRTEKLLALGWEGKRILWSDYKKLSKEEQVSLIEECKLFLI